MLGLISINAEANLMSNHFVQLNCNNGINRSHDRGMEHSLECLLRDEFDVSILLYLSQAQERKQKMRSEQYCKTASHTDPDKNHDKTNRS